MSDCAARPRSAAHRGVLGLALPIAPGSTNVMV
jgi:hypothetical protein